MSAAWVPSLHQRHPAPVNSAVNILVLDTLNTPMQDQTIVRQQLLDYLDKARPGRLPHPPRNRPRSL